MQELQGQVEYREPTTFKLLPDAENPVVKIEAPPYGNYQYDYRTLANRSR